jgi:hypothetical protein
MADWNDIMAAVGTALAGDKTEGRRALMACWERTEPGDHAFRCVLAHYLADTESGLEREIVWDETALAEHLHVGDGELAPLGIQSTRALLPSLHLNLGDGYLRRGDIAAAGRSLAQGLAHADALGEDGYGTMIRSGLANLADRIAATAVPDGV